MWVWVWVFFVGWGLSTATPVDHRMVCVSHSTTHTVKSLASETATVPCGRLPIDIFYAALLAFHPLPTPTPTHTHTCCKQVPALVCGCLVCICDSWEQTDGTTPLFVACRKGHVSVVQTLLDRGAVVQPSAPGLQCPLFIAGQEGHTDIVRLLLARGANANYAEVWT